MRAYAARVGGWGANESGCGESGKVNGLDVGGGEKTEGRGVSRVDCSYAQDPIPLTSLEKCPVL